MSSQQRILQALKEARQRLDAVERARSEPIAVVGMGCRFPGGVDSPDSLWRLLEGGVDAMSEVPPDRWDLEEYYDPDPDAPGKMYAREAGFVDRIDEFDPTFFRISPREAVSLDPQQRLLLEVVWESLEDAGIPAESVRGSDTGFFIGLSWHDYERNAYGLNPQRLDAYSAMGNTQSIAVGRLAFFLGSHGPTTLLDTACSSSLVAIHAACQSLRLGESSAALAGGVNLMISPLSTIFCCKIKALAPDSRCKTFDAAADGYARGEGCGIVVLKRLSDAIADGDHIRAVIRGTAINHDGPASGLTVPNRAAQKMVIEAALRNGRVDPLDVGYVEAHGTGTALGDPIEVAALGDALGRGRPPERPLRIGSLKTNFGHLEAAAGVAGFMKAVLAIERGVIPAHLHFHEPSPNIAWNDFPVEVPVTAADWGPGRRVAGVSSFGFSGTNAHAILEEAPALPEAQRSVERPAELLCLSARSEEALRELAGRHADHLSSDIAASLSDICHTANAGRARFPHRLAALADTKEHLATTLGTYRTTGEASGTIRGKAASGTRLKVAFLFTGQGSQWVGMGHELYRSQPVFRAALDECSEHLANELERPLLEVMFEGASGGDGSPLLHQTAYTQPALFALEWALGRLWRSWGVEPAIVLGHSVGEYVAACWAGVFSLEDGLRLIAARGRLMQSLPLDGAMVAVHAAEDRVADAVRAFSRDVSVATINGPRNVVVSGRASVLRDALAPLRDAGVKTRDLVVSHAFHSPLMDPVLDEFERIASGVAFRPPQLDLVSNVSGRVAGSEVAQASYWRQHIRDAVRFADGIVAAHETGIDAYLEIGPSPTLVGMGRQSIEDPKVAWLTSLRKEQPEWPQMLLALGELFTRGIQVDWQGFECGHPPRRIPLPTYPFQRQSYWVEGEGYGSGVAAGGPREDAGHPLLGTRLHSAAMAPGDCLFEGSLGHDSPAWLGDHRVFSETMPPATCWLEMACAASQRVGGAAAVENVTVHQPLFLTDGRPRVVQVVVRRESSQQTGFEILSFEPAVGSTEAGWVRHASGSLGLAADDHAAPTFETSGFAAEDALAAADCHQRLLEQDLDLGESFRTLRRLWQRDGEVVAEVGLAPALEREARNYGLHPALLDACGQAIAVAFPPEKGSLFLPVGFERVEVLRPGIGSGWVRAQLRSGRSPDLRTADVEFFGNDGELVARIKGATTRRVDREAMLRSLRQMQVRGRLYHRVWREEALSLPAEAEAGAWLILGAGSELARSLSSRLEAQGQRVLSLPATSKDDLAALSPTLTELSAEGQPPLRGVVDLRATEVAEMSGRSADAVLEQEVQVCSGVIALLTILSQARLKRPPQVLLVTRGCQVPDPEAEVNPAAASLDGLGAVMALEHPELRCKRGDLPPRSVAGEVDALCAELLGAASDDQVAWRDDRRFVARLQERAQVQQSRSLPVDSDSRYLITGGLGALGLEVARWLVTQGARHLLLMGRSAPGTDAAATIESLRSEGVSVEVAAVDVANRDDLDRALSGYLEGAVPLRGIVHAAGVLDDGILLQLDADRLRRAMLPKVAGTWNLHRATASSALDFFVCFSSAAPVLGSRGQGNYAAANAFMDTLMQHRRQRGLPALSVNWGPWAEVGMAADLDDLATRRMFDQGWSPIPTKTGMESLAVLMCSDTAQAAVLPLRWASFLGQYPADGVPAFFTDVAEAAHRGGDAVAAEARDDVLSKLSGVNQEERRDVLVEFLRSRLAATLSMDDPSSIDLDLSFAELGIDSLLQMELRGTLASALGLDIPLADFIDSSTVSDLTDLVLKHLALNAIAAADEDGDATEDMEEFVL